MFGMRVYAMHGILNRILSGVLRPKNPCPGVQPAWSTPDRIGWTKPLYRGAGPTGNWNPRPRAPRHAESAHPSQDGRRRGQVAPCLRLWGAAHPANAERLGSGFALGARTGPLPAGYPSVTKGKGTAAQGRIMAVLWHGAPFPGATGGRAWRSPLSGPGDSADSARYRCPCVDASAQGPIRALSVRAAVG
jgi:hypothetical protein